MDIADIVRSVVGGGGQPQPSAVNPSGYSEATPTGRDPTQGGALRDRFHQMRGDEYQMTEGTPLAQKIAVEFLQSRGAPVNQQNLQVAQQYLRGGALGGFAQQQSTEDQIADEAVAADAGVSAGGGAATTPPPTGTPPARPVDDIGDDPPTVIPAVDDPGGIPGIGPEWMLGPLLARTAKDVGDRVANAGKPGPRAPVAAEPAVIPARQVDEAVPETARAPAPEVVPTEAVSAAAADVPPQAVDVPPQVAEAPVPMEAPPAPAESAPIATEEVVPKTETPQRVASQGTIDVNGKSIPIEVTRGGSGVFTAKGPDGITATGKTLAAAKAAIRKAISAAF